MGKQTKFRIYLNTLKEKHGYIFEKNILLGSIFVLLCLL